MFKESLGMNLRVAYLAFHRLANSLLGEDGLTADQFVVMSLLKDEPGITQRDLVEFCGSDSSTIAAMLKILERKGLLVRNEHDSDKRKRCVTLTPDGQSCHSKLAQKVVPLQKELEESIPPGRVDEFAQTLQSISQMMNSTKLIKQES